MQPAAGLQTTEENKPLLCTLGSKKVALILSGSFNPPTFVHLRMFERAKSFLEQTLGVSVLEGVISPISDVVNRPELAPAVHRVRMVQLSVKTSSWIKLDTWQCTQAVDVSFLHLLRHFRDTYAAKFGVGAVHVMLLCGGDVLDAFASVFPCAQQRVPLSDAE
ncbi:Cytidylyltransferase family protein, partial [Aphelenchoides avenae]